jgi:WD40 repeat protein
MPGGKCLYSKIPDTDNELYCMDYNASGTRFSVAGKNKRVYVYDDETKKIVNDMHEGLRDLPGHGNRIFSTKFDPLDDNVLISGGWDRSL